jgi:putative ABC transport system ATP-binding protein
VADPFVLCENLLKIYRVGDTDVMALQGLDLAIARGEMLALVGPSGSGKSTFMNILGGLDRPTAGRIAVDGRSLLQMSDAELDLYRRNRVGFVWQQSARNLIPYLSALENVELPILLAGETARVHDARELLDDVGLDRRRGHRLSQLSGGEQQRVAIAVALANRPSLLLGDELTGELDTATAHEVLEVLGRLNERFALTTVLVTHDQQVADSVARVVTIRDGKTSMERIRHGGPESRDEQGAFREYVVLDSAGRLQIPPDIREEFGIGTRVEMDRVESGILIRPVPGAPASGPAGAGADAEDREDAGRHSGGRTRGLGRGLLSFLSRRSRRHDAG